MIALVFIVGVLSWAWVYSPTEFTFSFEVEDHTLDVFNNFTKVYENKSEVENVMNDALNKYSGGSK